MARPRLCNLRPASIIASIRERIHGVPRWNTDHLTFWIDPRAPEPVQNLLEPCYYVWSKHANIFFTRIDERDNANLICTATEIDGVDGILAEHDFPFGTIEPDQQLTGWLDMAEDWTEEMLVAAWTHEVGHGLGLDHVPEKIAKCLMNPYTDVDIFVPQEHDIKAIQELYP